MTYTKIQSRIIKIRVMKVKNIKNEETLIVITMIKIIIIQQ